VICDLAGQVRLRGGDPSPRRSRSQNNITLKGQPARTAVGVVWRCLTTCPPNAIPVVEGNSEVTNGDVLGGKPSWSVSMRRPFVCVNPQVDSRECRFVTGELTLKDCQNWLVNPPTAGEIGTSKARTTSANLLKRRCQAAKISNGRGDRELADNRFAPRPVHRQVRPGLSIKKPRSAKNGLRCRKGGKPCSGFPGNPRDQQGHFLADDPKGGGTASGSRPALKCLRDIFSQTAGIVTGDPEETTFCGEIIVRSGRPPSGGRQQRCSPATAYEGKSTTPVTSLPQA